MEDKNLNMPKSSDNKDEAITDMKEKSLNNPKGKNDGRDGRDSEDEGKKSVASRLVELCEDLELFHTEDDVPYADVIDSGRRRTLAIDQGQFSKWLSHAYYKQYGTAPNTHALEEAINTLAGKALYEGVVLPVYVRKAFHNGKLYIDICDGTFDVIEVDHTGWRIVSEVPVRFRQPKNLTALSRPEQGGSLIELRDLLNVDNDTWVLLLGWLVNSWAPSGPYFMLVLSGEQGTGKSSVARLLKAVVDPDKAGLRSAPNDRQSLAVAAHQGLVLAFDNLSHINQDMSDAFCLLATGGSWSKRTNYTDDGETVLNLSAPCIVTSIVDVVKQSDLLERTLVVTLKVIPSSERKTEREIREAYDQSKGRIVGALLDAVVTAFRELLNTRLTDRPRMADAAEWITVLPAAKNRLNPAVGCA